MFASPITRPALIIPHLSSGVVTSYSNVGGTGDRRSIITLTQSSLPVFNSNGTTLLDGDTTSNNREFFRNNLALDGSTYWFKFDFGSGKSVVINEAKYYQQTSTGQGTWKWQGSNDNSTWTDIGGTFSLVTAATTTLTSLSGNTTFYRYYRMLGMSGNTSFSPWIYQMEFKISGLA